MTKLAAALLIALTAAPVLAQTATPAPAPAPAPAATPAAGKFTIDTPIATIAADPAGRAVLDADFPGMTAHPMYDSFKGMTLIQLQPVANGQITDAQIAKARIDLAALK